MIRMGYKFVCFTWPYSNYRNADFDPSGRHKKFLPRGGQQVVETKKVPRPQNFQTQIDFSIFEKFLWNLAHGPRPIQPLIFSRYSDEGKIIRSGNLRKTKNVNGHEIETGSGHDQLTSRPVWVRGSMLCVSLVDVGFELTTLFEV